MYQQGKADKILLTNDGVLGAWSENKQRNMYQVEWAENDLLKHGIPENAIIKLPYSTSGTIYDAMNTRIFVTRHNIKNILILTSDYHTRRSLLAFSEVFRGYAVNIGVYPVKLKQKTILGLNEAIKLSFELLKYMYYKFTY